MKAILTAAMLGSVTSAAATESVQQFDVYLDDEAIGQYQVTLHTQGDRRQVEITTQMQVDVLFLTAYQYRHQAREEWHGDCLRRLDTTTDDDGEPLFVRATQQAGGLTVTTPEAETILPGCVRSFAYWDPTLLDSDRLLNGQNGRYESADLTRLTNSGLQFNGQTYGTQHYRLSVEGGITIQLWYGPNNHWQALQTTVDGDRVLRYVLRTESPS